MGRRRYCRISVRAHAQCSWPPSCVLRYLHNTNIDHKYSKYADSCVFPKYGLWWGEEDIVESVFGLTLNAHGFAICINTNIDHKCSNCADSCEFLKYGCDGAKRILQNQCSGSRSMFVTFILCSFLIAQTRALIITDCANSCEFSNYWLCWAKRILQNQCSGPRSMFTTSIMCSLLLAQTWTLITMQQLRRLIQIS